MSDVPFSAQTPSPSIVEAEKLYSLLPPRLEGVVRSEWRHTGSSKLCGDGFGYHWVDDRHLAIYLFDLSGHEAGASPLVASPALPSSHRVEILNLLRLQTLENTAFTNPSQVLEALSKALSRSGEALKLFTIWYGVYDTIDEQLRYASIGHPPPIFLDRGNSVPFELGATGITRPVDAARKIEIRSQPVFEASRLFLYSDGAFKVKSPDGDALTRERLVQFISRSPILQGFRMPSIMESIEAYRSTAEYPDDFSMLEIVF